MKTFRPMLHALFLVVSISILNSKALAQNDARLPPELNQNSSLSEVLGWLDKTSFAGARIGLNDSGSPGYDETWGTHQDGTPATKVVFSQGFKLTNVDDCTFTLRNDDVKLLFDDVKVLFFDSKVAEQNIGDPQTKYVAELYVPLYRLSHTKGKAPYRHTKNPEKARLLGTWRTEFKHKGFFARHDVGIFIFPAGQREKKVYWDGETLTFTFDSQEMSEKFNAAFRRAIKLCKAK